LRLLLRLRLRQRFRLLLLWRRLGDGRGNLRTRHIRHRLRRTVRRGNRRLRAALFQPRYLAAWMFRLLRAHDVAEQKTAAEASANCYDYGSDAGEKGG
jgi:hypothetical protein